MRWAVERLTDPQGSGRLLVADEVGLGKTFVAQGVVDELSRRHRGPGPYRVFYICSSLSIASQNEGRIRDVLLDEKERERAHVQAERLSGILNVADPALPTRFLLYTVTPGTSFTPGTGVIRERQVLARCVARTFGYRAYPWLIEAFRVGAGPKAWGYEWSSSKVPQWFDDRMCADFRARAMCAFRHRARGVELEEHVRSGLCDVASNRAFVAKLRAAFTLSIVGRIKPDLVVFDEFQRFFSVLPMDAAGDEETADVSDKDVQAREIVDALLGGPVEDTLRSRVLMLSATPYRMYARSVEAQQHHHEFYRLLEFLYASRGAAESKALKSDFARYREALERGDPDLAALLGAKQALEDRLRAVMVRTERSRLLRGVYQPPRIRRHDVRLSPVELRGFRHLIASCAAQHRSMAEPFWSSVPLPLQTMGREYVLSRDATRAAVPRGEGGFRLRFGALRSYRAFGDGQYPHTRLRGLLDALPADVLGLPWIPPSCPWWTLGAPFLSTHSSGPPSKALVFSRFRAVPRAVATLLSYEAERALLQHGSARTSRQPYDWRSRSARAEGADVAAPAGAAALRANLQPLPSPSFTVGSGPTWCSRIAMFLPWPTLASVVDPLALAVEAEGPLSREAAVASARERLVELLGTATAKVERESVWRWIVRLERRHRSPEWVAFEASLRQWRRLGLNESLFDVPDDGVRAPGERELDELAEIAVAGPGPMLVRAARRVFHLATRDERADRASSLLESALALCRYLDTPEWIVAFKQRYKRAGHASAAIRLAAWHGNLEAVLDEFLAVEQGLGTTRPASRGAAEALAALRDVLALKETRLDVSRLGETGDAMKLRCHAALAYGLTTTDDESGAPRADHVRAAFNSPFRPMVLVTTSIGQEGLDFHRWARHLVHWDLPDNPVDLEQRDGRLNRHGSLAVRVALGARTPVRELDASRSPWHSIAQRFEPPPSGSGIEPWWHFDGATLRRTLLVASFSNQWDRCLRLQAELDLYRLALGQPEQEQLLARLRQRFNEVDGERDREWLRQAAIDLSPRV